MQNKATKKDAVPLKEQHPIAMKLQMTTWCTKP